MATSLTRDETKWAGTLDLATKTKKLTLNTADKYVDKDIEISITAKDGSGAIKGGALTHNGITTNDKTYLTGTVDNGYKITMSNSAKVGEISVDITEGWLEEGAIAAKPETVVNTVSNDFYIKKGSAAVTTGQSIPVEGSITRSGKTITASLKGSKTISGSATAGWVTGITGASVSASGSATIEADKLDTNLVAGNIVKNKTIFGITGTGANATKATFANEGTTGKTYKDISADAPVLVSGSYLFINEGCVPENQKISLAQLVPDGSNVIGNEGLIYKTVSAYNKNGELVAGTMQDASVKSGAPSLSGTPTVGAKTTAGKYPLSATINVAAPSVSSGGYITTDKGTKNNNSGNVTINLDAATCTIAGGGLTSGIGATSVAANGLVGANGAIDATDKIALTTSSASGYYKITSSGSGSVNRAAITDKHTAGWLEAKDTTTVSAATSLSSNTATQEYFIKKSTGATQTVTPKTTKQTVTLGAGYYPSDRTITINAVDPTDSSQVGQGALSAADSTISSVTATAGTATVDATKLKYNIPLTLNASGAAYAKVSTAGYVTTAKNTSKAISGSGSATVSLDLYDGAFSWS